jgi:hypothetical protein
MMPGLGAASLMPFSNAIGIAPWFEWNGTDLTQFDTKIEGGAITASTVQITSYGGFNWIDISITGTGGAGPANGIFLPITKTPPGTNVAIAFEFISRQVIATNGIVGAGAALRCTSLSQGYFCRYGSRSVAGSIQDMGKFTAGENNTIYQDMDDPRLDGLDRGTRMALSVLGIGSGVLVKMIVGEPAIYLETSPYDDVGQAGLYQTTVGGSGTVRNYYRNIKCYLASDVEKFEI